MPADYGESLAVVGVDVGGTFIDFVALDQGGRLRTHKQLSDPADIGAAFLAGMERIAPHGVRTVVHGTTVATNALLERRGARTALVTTAGFGDVLEIGRQDRPQLYSLSPIRSPPLVPRDLRFEVEERIGAGGSVIAPLDQRSVAEMADRLAKAGVESIAVSLLFSFLHPDHERRVAEAVSRAVPGAFVSASHEVVPEFREYERTATTALNAYVSPLLRRYLARTEAAARQRFGVSRLEVMQSNGGVLEAEDAGRLGARLILSGPAAGVVGAFDAARQAGIDRIISFDMGGTSTDVALCDREIPTTTESVIGGVPIRLPMIDVHTVGAGGGSIARVDSGGALQVGPQSAGSDPGPACYGRGTLPTVTDAQALAGRLDAESFLGGGFALDLERSAEALGGLAASLGVEFREAVAGVLRVVNAAMERATRIVSVERGHDPREFTLVAFGGAGPLHACELASALRMRRVLIPPFPGVTSAFGMAAADRVRDFSRTVMVPLGDVAALESLWADLEARARRALPGGEFSRTADCRYRGQGYELEVDADPASAIGERFHEAHRRRYGYADPARTIELVNVRLTARERGHSPGSTPRPPTPRRPSARVTELLLDSRRVEAPVIERAALAPADTVDGPALLVQADTATVVLPGWTGRALAESSLLVEATNG